MTYIVSSLVYKYQLMFVYVTHVESGGVSQMHKHISEAEILLSPALVERRRQSLARIGGLHAMFNDFE